MIEKGGLVEYYWVFCSKIWVVFFHGICGVDISFALGVFVSIWLSVNLVGLRVFEYVIYAASTASFGLPSISI